MIEVKHLTKAYHLSGLRKKEKRIACENISFSIAPGEIFGLIGESGCGKTTIANLILRLSEPDSGEVWIDGVNTTNLHGYRLLKPVRRRIQHVPQSAGASLNPRMTIGRIISEPLRNYRISSGMKSSELLDLVGLPRDFAKRRPASLSGGQRQRVAIARALALYPKTLILDEPTSNLDIAAADRIIDLLCTINRECKISMLFITHDISRTMQFCHRNAVMQNGRLLEILDDLNKTENPYTRQLLDASNLRVGT